MIKFDLHIHSIASKYKENNNIVDESTHENIDILLTKLNDYQVSLFSITDHNRFNVELYKKIDSILNRPECKYHNVKSVLSGVEFDIQIDEKMGKCHVITIFDSKNKSENYDKINKEISKKELKTKDDFYTKEDFEQLLYNIGLNTILIACQRKDIHNHSGHHNSLSDSSKKVEEIISVGYINALEYQKPKVEGILKNNLKTISSPISLVTGSDCHMWSCYPHHDNINKNNDFYHSKAKILPTFKGLLMAITSPETRFNCRENSNTDYLKQFYSAGEVIHLENGINAIIGENGSGKSTLLKFINNNTKESFVRDLIKKNQLQLKSDESYFKIKYIGQGDIINKFNNNNLFSSITDNNFKELDNSGFIEKYTQFAHSIKKVIQNKINQKKALDVLKNHIIKYNPDLDVRNYYIHLNCRDGFDDIINIHDEPLYNIKNIILNLRNIKLEDYYRGYVDSIVEAENALLTVYLSIKNKWQSLNIEVKIKNIIQNAIADYNYTINSKSSARDKEKKENADRKQKVVDAVTKAIRLNNVKIKQITEPDIQRGVSVNRKNGFCFNREAFYNNKPMLEEFLSCMFNKEYNTLESILEIKTIDEFVEALRNCTKESNIELNWEENFNKFMRNATQVKEYITDGSDKQIGNTLGEMSLSFYKYYTQDSDDWNILIMDQPEDNISNNNINNNLIKYFNSISDKKQLILVTHNPLLVVNLDVDNVVYMKNKDGKLSFKSGCLEYEDNDINILDLIARNMDGGKESIEKRLKVYGK